MLLGKLLREFFLVEGCGFEHGEDDVAAARGDAHDSGVVLPALGVFPGVVGPGDRVMA
jgi:hypothetical protein